MRGLRRGGGGVCVRGPNRGRACLLGGKELRSLFILGFLFSGYRNYGQARLLPFGVDTYTGVSDRRCIEVMALDLTT